jgi:hypothetical protein
MVRVRVGVPYFTEGVIFGSEVNGWKVRFLSSRAESFGNAVVERFAVGRVDRARTLRVRQMS